MKNVLLPTDFSENAWNATKYAIELFKDEECIFHLLNTYTPAIVSSRFMGASMGHVQESNVRDNSEKGLKEVLGKIKKNCNYPKHNFKTISSFNLLIDEVKDIVEAQCVAA